MASEWWHFQYEGGLTVGESTFGDELLQIYSLDEVIGSPPWAYRKHIWGENWH